MKLKLSKLFGTLRSKLGTTFWKYLLKVSTISKSVSSLPFSTRDKFSKLFDLLEKKLFTVFWYFLLSTVSHFQIRIVCLIILVFFNKLKFTSLLMLSVSLVLTWPQQPIEFLLVCTCFLMEPLCLKWFRFYCYLQIWFTHFIELVLWRECIQ